ncbi:MAG: hypothetical protein IPK10_07770 [Bacteroidetes bacterium]|nr:hypothetical protein [Bacteroidota bacterium]
MAVTTALDLRREEANSQETKRAAIALPDQKKNLLGTHLIMTDHREERGGRERSSRAESAERLLHEEEVILMTVKNALIKEETTAEKAVHHFQEGEVIHAMVKNALIKEETTAEKAGTIRGRGRGKTPIKERRAEKPAPSRGRSDHAKPLIKEETTAEIQSGVQREESEEEESGVQRAESAERLLHEEEVILMTVKNALIGEQRAESRERRHLVKNVLTRNVMIVQREVKGEECINDARKVLRDSRESDPLRGRSLESRVRRILKENVHIKEETIVKVDLEKNAHIKEEMIMLVDSGENVLFRETKKEKEVRREDPIVSDRQVEKIVMHALKKNHLTEIVHLMEKAEVAVAPHVNEVLVQVRI